MKPVQAPKKTILAMKKVTWKVPNYSKTYFAGCKTGESIKSNTFTVSKAGFETKWFLYMCPNGSEEEYKSHISLYLHSASANEADCIEFNVKFRLGVVKKNHQYHYSDEPECKRSKEEMKKCGYGYYKLLSHTALFDEAKAYVVDGTLTICVELKVEYEVENLKPQTRVDAFTALSAKMKDDYKNMFENDALSDFQLKVSDGEILKAHKTILAARSPVFFAMLTNDMTEAKEGSVDVPDIDSVAMKEVLRFIYYNEVKGLKQIAPMLIFAAEKYQLDALKVVCLEEILSALDEQNVIESLKIAHQVSGADALFKGCLDLILNNYSEVKQYASWNELPKELVIKILYESLERSLAI